MAKNVNLERQEKHFKVSALYTLPKCVPCLRVTKVGSDFLITNSQTIGTIFFFLFCIVPQGCSDSIFCKSGLKTCFFNSDLTNVTFIYFNFNFVFIVLLLFVVIYLYALMYVSNHFDLYSRE